MSDVNTIAAGIPNGTVPSAARASRTVRVDCPDRPPSSPLWQDLPTAPRFRPPLWQGLLTQPLFRPSGLQNNRGRLTKAVLDAVASVTRHSPTRSNPEWREGVLINVACPDFYLRSLIPEKL